MCYVLYYRTRKEKSNEQKHTKINKQRKDKHKITYLHISEAKTKNIEGGLFLRALVQPTQIKLYRIHRYIRDIQLFNSRKTIINYWVL